MGRDQRGDDELHRFMVALDNAAFDPFPSVVDPEVPPTNNAAEWQLRELAVLRKIRGGCERLPACGSCRLF